MRNDEKTMDFEMKIMKFILRLENLEMEIFAPKLKFEIYRWIFKLKSIEVFFLELEWRLQFFKFKTLLIPLFLEAIWIFPAIHVQ